MLPFKRNVQKLQKQASDTLSNFYFLFVCQWIQIWKIETYVWKSPNGKVIVDNNTPKKLKYSFKKSKEEECEKTHNIVFLKTHKVYMKKNVKNKLCTIYIICNAMNSSVPAAPYKIFYCALEKKIIWTLQCLA